jgi:hypothetical protein
MITLSMISLFVGAALGQRFKIRVLIPAFAILVILAVGAGLTHARTAWHVVLIVATAAACLQIGYFFGIGVLRHLLAAALPRRSTPLASSPTPARHAAR